jgi:hypothetical protein
MAGFIPAIHALLCSQGVDARDKRGHDVERLVPTNWKLSGPLPALDGGAMTRNRN